MESDLYVAAVTGNMHSLLELLAKDKPLPESIMTGNRTPLHIAAMLGNLEFVVEVLARKAELTSMQDSQESTPLHLAAAKGYLNIVVCLLRVNPDICFIRDKYERNPLHVAAMKGHVDVLEFLVQERPDAARDRVEHDQTILHLCVKHERLEALKLLIDILGDDKFINSRDEDGNTILHLAAAYGQTKTMLFLTDKGCDRNIKNSKGFTALGLLAQGESAGRASEIKDSVPQTSENPPVGEEEERERKRKWQNSMHKTLMVVATLLATMAFQASITPPGGLWQDNFEGEGEGEGKKKPHNAGESIMADKYSEAYKSFVTCNTISFVASLSIIMLLISGLPLKRRRISTWIAMLTMWVAITFAAATYAISVFVFTPESELKTFNDAIGGAVMAWVGLMALLFLCHVVRLIWKLVRKVLKLVCKVLKFVRKALTKRRPEDLMV